MHVCVCGQNYVGDAGPRACAYTHTHMHSVLLSVSGRTAVDVEQQSSRAAGERCSRHQSLLSPGWGKRLLHIYRVNNTEETWAFITFSVCCLAFGQSSGALVKGGVDAVVHMYGCKIIAVIWSPGYLEWVHAHDSGDFWECLSTFWAHSKVLFDTHYSSFTRGSNQAVIFVLVVFMLWTINVRLQNTVILSKDSHWDV